MANYEIWEQTANTSNINVLMNTAYTLQTVSEVFSWTNCIRAGIIVVYKNKILLVRERKRKISDGHNANKVIAEHFGIPKGAPIKTDKNLFATAIRELHEETGIVIKPANFKLCKSTITIERNEKLVNSVHIYFIVFAITQPIIKIQSSEISGFRWVDFGDMPGFMNKPCTQILTLFKNIDIEQFRENSI